MKRCPITYEPLTDHQTYSPQGLRLLNRGLKSLAPLEFTAEQQRQDNSVGRCLPYHRKKVVRGAATMPKITQMHAGVKKRNAEEHDN